MDELEDYTYNASKPRRRSNSISHNATNNKLKSKFEDRDDAPVFEEEIHGASAPDFIGQMDHDHEEMEKLEKQSTVSSMESVDEMKE